MNGITAGWAILCVILALLLGYSIYSGYDKNPNANPLTVVKPQQK
jgi:hypothetical protein